MALLTKIKAAIEGAAYTLTAVAASDTFQNNGECYLIVNNGGASSDSVTIVARGKCECGDLHNEVVTVANGSAKIIGPFRPDRFNDSSGLVTVQHSYTTSVTCAVIEASN
jgi:hypothetical protein